MQDGCWKEGAEAPGRLGIKVNAGRAWGRETAPAQQRSPRKQYAGDGVVFRALGRAWAQNRNDPGVGEQIVSVAEITPSTFLKKISRAPYFRMANVQ